jgi:AcrR family transcriptional regulator
LAAAVELFSEKGWTATGMRDIASAADVSVETVYAKFGSKADLLMAALDVAVVGDALPIPLADRPEFRALSQGPLTQRAAAVAGLITRIHARTAGVDLALREGASADPDLSDRLREGERRRRTSIEQGMSLVAGRAVTPRERDGLWAITSADTYRLLTQSSRWSRKAYQEWLAGVIVRLLAEWTDDKV